MPNLTRGILVEDQFGKTNQVVADAGDAGSTTLERSAITGSIAATNTQTVVFPWVPSECPGKIFSFWYTSIANTKTVTLKDAAGTTISAQTAAANVTNGGVVFYSDGVRWWELVEVAAA